MNDSANILEAAEQMCLILKQHRVDALVIGGVALAAHKYIRQTDDMDLGVNADIPTLYAVSESLKEAGFSVELREPDASDPLGGVLDVRGPFGLVQIVNFGNRFPAVIEDALHESTLYIHSGSLLKIAPIPHLVALKLYAGGFKSKADIVELLSRNPEANREKIRNLCRKYRLKGVDEVLADDAYRPESP